VLDASEPIRTLVNMTGSTVIKAKDAILERHGVKVDFEGLKRWDNNTVNQVVSGSGRTPIEVEMLKPLKKREKFRPLINAMKALPDGEAALVIHFMKRFNPYLFAKTKNKRAKKAIDHVAEIKKRVTRSPSVKRAGILHIGALTTPQPTSTDTASTSSYSEPRNKMMLTSQRRSWDSLAACYPRMCMT